MTRKSPLTKPRLAGADQVGQLDAVEFAPSDGAIALCAENGRRLRAILRPLRHNAMKEVAIGKNAFVIIVGELRHAHIIHSLSLAVGGLMVDSCVWMRMYSTSGI